MANHKKERQVAPENRIRPGMILVGNEGYSMEIPVFYEVMGLTPSGKSARIRKLAADETMWDRYGGRGTAMPVPHSYTDEVRTCRICVYDRISSLEPYEYVKAGKIPLMPWNGKAMTYDYMN